MERPNFFHRTARENVNLLFNMIQACRNDLSAMRFNPSYNCKPDEELVKCAEALAIEARQWITEINEMQND